MAITVNMVIDQGTDFSTPIVVRDDDGIPIPLGSYVGRSKMKKHHQSANSYPFVVTTADDGTVTLSMNAATTGTLTDGRWVYDVELVSASNVVSRIVEGVVRVKPRV